MNNDIEVCKLHALASRFRDAVERCERRKLSITFKDFPRGSCGDTSVLLGTFLLKQGYLGLNYVLGTKNYGNDERSHAWIEANSIIVDITADQFPEIEDKIIVTRSSTWHLEFQQDRPYNSDYRIFDPNTVIELESAYKLILRNLSDLAM